MYVRDAARNARQPFTPSLGPRLQRVEGQRIAVVPEQGVVVTMTGNVTDGEDAYCKRLVSPRNGIIRFSRRRSDQSISTVQSVAGNTITE